MSEPVQQIHHVRREPDAHRHVGERILKDQVPADDPRDQFAHRRVGVRVRRPRNRNHRRQLRVTEPRECAHNRHQQQRNASAGPAPGRPAMAVCREKIVELAEYFDRRRVELLPRHRGPDDGKDPRPDHRANAQRRQRNRPKRLLQAVIRDPPNRQSACRSICARTSAVRGWVPAGRDGGTGCSGNDCSCGEEWVLCECNGFARPAEEDPPAPRFSALALSARYRFDCPRASFLTFFFSDPRGVVRFALGAAFLRAARFNFLACGLVRHRFRVCHRSFCASLLLPLAEILRFERGTASAVPFRVQIRSALAAEGRFPPQSTAARAARISPPAFSLRILKIVP